MFEIYSTIAFFLLLTGIVSVLYFGSFCLKTNTNKNILLTVTAECVLTLLLGAFYTYSAVILSNNSDQKPFVNNIDDLAIINTNIPDEENTNYFEVPQNEELTTISSDQAENEIPDTRKLHANNDFLVKYKQFIKNVIEQSSRERKMIKHFENDTTVSEKDPCFIKDFLQNGLLLCSFLHCAILLLILIALNQPNTENHNNSTKEGQDIEAVESASTKSDSELFQKGRNFGTKTSSTPNFDHFNVKRPKTPPKPVARVNGTVWKCLITPLVEVITISIFLAVLFSILRNIESNHSNSGIFEVSSFNISAVESNLEKLPLSYVENKTAQHEIDLVVSNIYYLVDFTKQVNEQDHSSQMNDFLTYIRHKNHTVDSHFCTAQKDVYLKLYKFVIFIICFVLVIIFVTLRGPELCNKKLTIIFSAMWLPAIVDLSYKSFIQNQQYNLVSALFLLLGNGNVLVSVVKLYEKYFRNIKNDSSVEPNEA